MLGLLRPGRPVNTDDRDDTDVSPAAQREPTYAALCETVRTSPVVVPDETGWKVRGGDVPRAVEVVEMPECPSCSCAVLTLTPPCAPCVGCGAGIDVRDRPVCSRCSKQWTLSVLVPTALE